MDDSTAQCDVAAIEYRPIKTCSKCRSSSELQLSLPRQPPPQQRPKHCERCHAENCSKELPYRAPLIAVHQIATRVTLGAALLDFRGIHVSSPCLSYGLSFLDRRKPPRFPATIRSRIDDQAIFDNHRTTKTEPSPYRGRISVPPKLFPAGPPSFRRDPNITTQPARFPRNFDGI